MLKPTDEELMERYQRGDVRAFGSLLERHEVRIYNYFLRTFGKPDVASDLTQDTFMRIVKGRKKFRRESKFATWMWRIAHNLSIDTFRRLKFRRHQSLDAPIRNDSDSSSRLEQTGDPTTIPADGATYGKQFLASLEDAIPLLDEEQREVFLLRQMEGLSFQQIADIQNVNVNTVKSRMRYALLKLREALAKYAPDGGES
ncbi:MAG: RNA polymerase subunit sigma [Myxococcales bacterium]|nr:RNA polymerase subunit sigma [Myxococcales bacterium]